MGLFSRPKVSEKEFKMVSTALNQARDTANLINTTVKPDVFFKRLNFFLDILLFLQRYEKYKIFKGTAPSAKYRQTIDNMDNIVNDFINRASQDCANKMAALKTNKAKSRRLRILRLNL